jgi:hypothetical protein
LGKYCLQIQHNFDSGVLTGGSGSFASATGTFTLLLLEEEEEDEVSRLEQVMQ